MSKDTFYQQIADAIMDSDAFKKRVSKVGDVRLVNHKDLRGFLADAARHGAEAVLGMMPEHDVEMGWVCTVCREPIVAKDIDENHTIWVHANGDRDN